MFAAARPALVCPVPSKKSAADVFVVRGAKGFLLGGIEGTVTPCVYLGVLMRDAGRDARSLRRGWTRAVLRISMFQIGFNSPSLTRRVAKAIRLQA